MQRLPSTDKARHCPYTLGRRGSASLSSVDRASRSTLSRSSSPATDSLCVYNNLMQGRVGSALSRPQSATCARATPSQPNRPRPQSCTPRPLMPHPPQPNTTCTPPLKQALGTAPLSAVVLTPTPPRVPVVGNANKEVSEAVNSYAEDEELGIDNQDSGAITPLSENVNPPTDPSPLSAAAPDSKNAAAATCVASVPEDEHSFVKGDANKMEGHDEHAAPSSDLSTKGVDSTRPSTKGALSALRVLRDAGSAVVAITRLQRIMPWASIEILNDRGIDVANLDKIMDKFVRFTHLVRGKMLTKALKRNRPAQNPAVEWELFVQGSDVVIISHTLLEVPLLGQAEERGEGMRRIDFTSSHMQFIGWGRDQMGERRLSYRELSGIDYSPSLKGSLITNFKVWSESPVRIRFGPKDAPILVGHLVQRMTHSFFRGSNIINGIMKKTVRIVHFNDVYHLEPFKNPGSKGLVGGASRFLTKVREIQKFHNPLILFSGDFMSPSLMSVLMKGKHMIDAFNLIGVHFGTFGNHEFDYGMQALSDAIHGSSKGNFVFAGSNTRWIVSNMTDHNGMPLCGALQQEIVVWNGVRVGLLGLSENWLPQCGQLKKEDWLYHDSIEVGERIAADMKTNAGVEVVIALCHNRLSKDYELAEGCRHIDLILGGHDHFYKNAPNHRVIKSGEEFEFLTEIELIIDPIAKDGRQVRYRSTAHPITSDIEPHPSMETIIERYNKRLESRMGKVIGTCSVPLDLTESCCRFKEGLAPGFIVDVMADRAKADFAVLGGAAISGKNVKPPGDITVGDIFSWFPNDTRIMTVRIKGSTVKKMLDVMVREVPNEAPSFPHPSRALTFTINTMRSPTVVQDICVNGSPIEMDKDYVVAVEDFVGLGKAKYKFVPVEGETLCDDEAAEQITYWIIDYFEKELEKSGNAERQLKLLTNIAMKDSLFGISNVKSKLEALANSANSEVGSDSLHVLSSSLGNNLAALSAAVANVGEVVAASILAEASRLATYQKTKLETVYFEIETALKRLVVCDQVRVFHILPNMNKAWYRSLQQGHRRTVVPIGGVVGQLVSMKRPSSILGSYPDPHSSFDPTLEGVGEATRSFMCLPIMFDKNPLCAVVFANGEGGKAFSEAQRDAAALFLSQAQPVVTFAVAAEEKEIEDERRKDLISAASDLVQNTETTTVNDTIVNISKHCKRLFAVEKAVFYVYDSNAEDLWTVRRSVNSQRQNEDVVIRKALAQNSVLASALRLRAIARYSEVSAMGLSANTKSERGFERNALVVPVESQKEKGTLCGLLLLADKIDGGFTMVDERLVSNLIPFTAIAIETTSELEVLRTGIDRSKLKAFPVHSLNRIRFKRGWGSVRSRLGYIASAHFQEKHAASLGEECSPLEKSSISAK